MTRRKPRSRLSRTLPPLFIFLGMALVLSLSSCDLFFGSSSSSRLPVRAPIQLFEPPSVRYDLPVPDGGRIGDETVKFYARDLQDVWRVVDAELLGHRADSAYLYVEAGESLGTLSAETILNEFAAKIRPMVGTYIGDAAFVDSLGFYTDDRSVIILALDLGAPDDNGAMLLGYFDPVHTFENDPNHSQLQYSNATPMLFLNSRVLTDWSEDDSVNATQFLLTLAHEFQHLNNFYTNIYGQNLGQMHTWIDEMLSAAAEYYYAGVQQARIDYFTGHDGFSLNEATTVYYNPYVALGQNHIPWGRTGSDILTSYASVHMKMNWLRLQSGNQSTLFADIVLSPYLDQRSVAIAASVNGVGVSDWKSLVRAWGAATRLQNPTGLFGYKGAISYGSGSVVTLNQILNDTNTTLSGGQYALYPGEFVYVEPGASSTFNLDNVSPGETVQYARLSSSGVLTGGSLRLGEHLLSYNVSANPNGSASATRQLPLSGQFVADTGISSLSTSETTSISITPPPGPHGVDMVFRDSPASGLRALEAE